jgi:formylglycine-generating enzyme required for sulfatase activity/proteasome lid subunit RPN8/RPN11
MDSTDHVLLPLSLRDRLISTIKKRLPLKTFGYILSEAEGGLPADFVFFESNIRNTPLWQNRFHSYGSYFVQHEDAGFVASPEESYKVQMEIWKRGMVEIGVFHSHLRHPANFSQIDYDMHLQTFHNMWHLIVSMRNPLLPQMRVFQVSQSSVRELQLICMQPASMRVRDPVAAFAEDVISTAREMLTLEANGRPHHKDSSWIYRIIAALLGTKRQEAIQTLLIDGFLRHSKERFEQHVAPLMCFVRGGVFRRGTAAAECRHFCGESPNRTIKLSPFRIGRVAVTNELLSQFDPARLNVSISCRQMPATNMTWFDAAVFAIWMGCRLPSEAQWEFACGGRCESDWCCDNEAMLPRYGWYCENSGGELHSVGTREANTLGLFDMHGNVWEWCEDQYDQDYFSASPPMDPLNLGATATNSSNSDPHRVCKGGSIHSLAEMCRTRYRFHEPPEFWAHDLGFRLAADAQPESGWRGS